MDFCSFLSIDFEVYLHQASPWNLLTSEVSCLLVWYSFRVRKKVGYKLISRMVTGLYGLGSALSKFKPKFKSLAKTEDSGFRLN